MISISTRSSRAAGLLFRTSLLAAPLAIGLACAESSTEVESDGATALYAPKCPSPPCKGDGGGGEDPDSAPATAVVDVFTDQTEPGVYGSGWEDETTVNLESNTRIQVDCDSGEGFTQVLPASVPWGNAEVANCVGDGARAQAMIPGLLSITSDGPVGTREPPGNGGYGANLNYFFLVDTNTKGRKTFGASDAMRNWVWFDGQVVTEDFEPADGVVDVWHVSANFATLYGDDFIAVEGNEDIPFRLRVIVTRQ